MDSHRETIDGPSRICWWAKARAAPARLWIADFQSKGRGFSLGRMELFGRQCGARGVEGCRAGGAGLAATDGKNGGKRRLQ